MPIYLQTQDVLNVSVSCFANNKTATNPKPVNLLTWLKSEKYRPHNEALRTVEDKEKRDALKGELPAITPSGLFTYRQESDLIPGSHTRLIPFDIDLKENGHILNYADLKRQICKLPFVAYCALSASGKGYWGLVPIAHPERHSQHFDALKRVFDYYGIQIDPAPRNVVSLRGYSYDAAPYQPERVMLFELYDLPPKPKPRPFALTTDADAEQTRVEVCISEVVRRGMCIGENYADWYAVGCSLANGFGESGREYYHQVSQHYPGYQYGATDKQFTACLRANSKATLGTFFLLCQQVGIEWKELMPLPSERPRRSAGAVDSSAAPRQNNTWLKDGRMIYGEVLTVEPATAYPSSWDEPNEPDAVPTISAKTFHQWQQQHPYYGRHGVASLSHQQ